MGQVQFWEGAILFVDGAIAMHENCCCEEVVEPCEDCYINQFSVVGTVDPPEGGACCLRMSGVWEWKQKAIYELSCAWEWDIVPEEEWYCLLAVHHYFAGPNIGLWKAKANAAYRGDVQCQFNTQTVEGVSCNKGTGLLAGECVLDGGADALNCNDRTLTLVFGG
ncbi:hypothetical protein ES708_21312 [subsurface metagenome]